MVDSNNSSMPVGEQRPGPSLRPTKSATAFRTISEVASDLDVAQHVLRFWESKFPQVRPMKRGGGRRYYRPEDVELLRTIRSLLYEEGYTIKGAQKLLKSNHLRHPEAEGTDPEGEAPRPPAAPAPGTSSPAPNVHRPAPAATTAAPTARPLGAPAPPARGRLEHLRDELVSLRDMLRRAAE